MRARLTSTSSWTECAFTCGPLRLARCQSGNALRMILQTSRTNRKTRWGSTDVVRPAEGLGHG